MSSAPSTVSGKWRSDCNEEVGHIASVDQNGVAQNGVDQNRVGQNGVAQRRAMSPLTQSARSGFGHALAIMLATVLVYANSTGNSFHYDDLHTIQENPHIRSLANIPQFFTSPESFSREKDYAMFRPLFLVSIAANYAWSGFDTYSYHLVNILLHATSSLLLWRILLGFGLAPLAALLGGMVFSVHPIGTEPVNYISSRSESLAAVFALAAFHLHQLRLVHGRVVYGVCSLICYGMGLLSKSVAITLPALLVLLEWTRHRRLTQSMRTMAPYGVIAALYLAIISGFVSKAIVGEPLRTMGIQAITQTKAVVYYLKLLIFPVGLSVHHQFF